MKLEQIYTKCLAQGAYYIADSGEAIIIDPLREIQPYLDRIQSDKVKLKYIFETHFHADFVSGHIDLANKTGAQIIYGPMATAAFELTSANDGQVFSVGRLTITVLHTPGHTLESSCFLLRNENGKPIALFSGDTLFLGDVGRPDLAQKAAHMTQAQLAGMLYESIQTKILPLPDDILIYPGHGAGSACGKNMMTETVDTLGHQRVFNYALQQPNKKAFVSAVLDGLLPPPGYFGNNVKMNKQGYDAFDKVMQKGLHPLSPKEFDNEAKQAAIVILDTRDSNSFSKGFVPGSINIGLSGEFAPWVGAILVDTLQPIILVCEDGKEEETITRLSRVGFDQVKGYLLGGISSWIEAGKPIEKVHRISAEEFVAEYNPNLSKVWDVRKESEYSADHIPNAFNKPLAYIKDWTNEVPKEDHFYIHCAGGYRSMIAASILTAQGIKNFSEIEGGFNSVSKTQIPRIATLAAAVQG